MKMPEPSTRRDSAAAKGLSRFVESCLNRNRSKPVAVRGIVREPCRFGTLYQVEILTVSLDGGDGIKLFLKHLGMEQDNHPDKQCRDREPRVYQELLNHHLPAPRCWGVRRNGACRDILLEYLDDWNLKYHGMPCWFEAARRLAHLHAALAEPLSRGPDKPYLLRMDAAYRLQWAQRACAVVERVAPGLAHDLEQVVHGYGILDDLLDHCPATLVHNDLAPKNVIALRSTPRPRICFVDWEMAGVGCGVVDLAHLCHGLGKDDETRMCEAYRGELAGTRLIPASSQKWNRLLAACKLHNTVYRLAHAGLWQLDQQRVTQWIIEARCLLEAARG